MPQPAKATMSRLQNVPTKIPDININPLFEHVVKKSEFKVLSEQKVVLTQDKAAWYIDLPVFEAEREVTETHVQTLYDEMVNGRFNANIVILATAIFRGKTYKINGQNTCFPPGTRVRMADGSNKPIESIRLLDEVLSAEGNIRKVMQSHTTLHDGELINVRTWGHGHLRCTPNHKILTKRGYVRADELTYKDWVPLPRFVPQTSSILLTESHVSGRRALNRARNATWPASSLAYHEPNCKEVPDVVKLDASFGRLIGLYLAEGNTSSNQVIWTFGYHEYDTIAAETVTLLKSALGVDSYINFLGDLGRTKVYFTGVLWRELFKSLCGVGVRHKVIHPDLLAGPREFLEAVFWGWMSGDGCERSGRYRCGATVSHDLALNMFDIANYLGLCPTINYESNKNRPRRRPVWKVQVPNGLILGYQPRAQLEEKVVWRKIRSLVREPFQGHVYNIGVEEDNSYVVEGVGVSNCWAKFFLPNYTPEVNEMVFEVDTEDGLKKLYSTFDRGKPRTEAHLIRVQLAGSDVVQGLTADIVSRLSSAIKLWLYENQVDHRRAKSFDVAELIQTKHAVLFRQVGGFLYRLPSKKDAFWKRSAVLAAMFETFTKSKEVSEDFWDRVISGENLTKHDARLMLRNYLLETALHAGAKKGKKSTDAETMYRTCINAWNKHRKGEPVEVMRSTDVRVKAR